MVLFELLVRLLQLARLQWPRQWERFARAGGPFPDEDDEDRIFGVPFFFIWGWDTKPWFSTLFPPTQQWILRLDPFLKDYLAVHVSS